MTARVLISTAGLKVSKPGIDVLTASDVSDFSFSSDYLGYGRYLAGTFTATGGRVETTFTFTGLGYIPMVLLSAPGTGVAGFAYRYVTPTGFGSGTITQGFTAKIEDGAIKVTNWDVLDKTIRYVIFRNPG